MVTLRHELVHAAGRRGHGKEFKALAVELGLTGPMTATIASPELLDFINWTLLPQLGRYPHGAITEWGEIVVPPTEPGDKPIILRPDDRPKKQYTRMLRAECPECGYTIRLTQKWADVGLPTCPTDGTALALDNGIEAGDGAGLHALPTAAVRADLARRWSAGAAPSHSYRDARAGSAFKQARRGQGWFGPFYGA